jgi:hypothetical protein
VGGIVPKFSLMALIIASVLIASGTRAVAQTIPNLPMAIMCWSPQMKSWLVGYLQTAKEDGSAMYRGLLVARVNAKGVVEFPDNRPGVNDCYGKTIDQLRATGRAMDFQRGK